MNDIKKIIYIFNKRQKIEFVFLIVITVIGGFVELLGVSSILPLVNTIMDENIIFENEIYFYIYSLLNMKSAREFVGLMAIALVVVFVIKNLYIVFMNNLHYKFIFSCQKKLSNHLFSSYMKQRYSFHLMHNSAELQRNVLQDVAVFSSTITAVMQLMTEIVVCVLLVAYLLSVDITTTISVILIVGVSTGIFYLFYHKFLGKCGQRYRELNALNIKWLQQSFGGVKEIKILHRETFFIDVFHNQYTRATDAVHRQKLLGVLPKPLMETLCIGGLLSVIAIQIYNGADAMNFIPTISVFAVAAFRMLPSFNRITSDLSVVMFNRAGVNAIYEELHSIEEMQDAYEESERVEQEYRLKMPLIFEKQIEVKDIWYRYENTETDVLKGINLVIPKNSSVAFIGASGSGKTTLVDNILGVLQPFSGKICVDGIDIRENILSWYDKLGYIPQNIYLTDDTIRNNIAFGIPAEEIDENKIWKALTEAQLDEFVKGLPEGLDTEIGEKGVRLSGGQRQRIGIARTLYNEPEVLVMDEATSALDNETENAFMESLGLLKGKVTMLVVAHRLTTVINCDVIYDISGGVITEVSHEEILEELNRQRK